MATKEFNRSEFRKRLEKLDHEYRLLLARRDMIEEAIAAKEQEINDFLYVSAHPEA